MITPIVGGGGGSRTISGSARPMQCGPSASWPVVLVPIGRARDDGAGVDDEVAVRRSATAKRSMPRGAGPPFFSPTWLYCEPWHGHSNHCEVGAVRHAAAEVRALLVQRDDPGLHAGRASAAGRPSRPSGARRPGTR